MNPRIKVRRSSGHLRLLFGAVGGACYVSTSISSTSSPDDSDEDDMAACRRATVQPVEVIVESRASS